MGYDIIQSRLKKIKIFKSPELRKESGFLGAKNFFMSNKIFEITKELQDTLKQKGNEHITYVYVDANGNHYFNVHKLGLGKVKNDKGEMVLDKTPESKWDLYGKGLASHRQVIPGMFNVDRITEVISKGDPSTKIVKTYSRKEIIETSVKPTGDSLIAKVANLSTRDRKALKEMLSEEEEENSENIEDSVSI